MFEDFYNRHFPLKSFWITEKHLGKPYITPGIIKSIKRRNKLQKLFAKWPLTYRNMLTTIIRTARDNYVKSKLHQESGDAQKTWKAVNSLIGKHRAQLPSSLCFSDKATCNNIEMAEKFNNYFSNIASELAPDIQPPSVSFESFLSGPVPFSFQKTFKAFK